MIAAEASGLPVETAEEPLIGWRTWFVLPDELLLRPIFMRGLAWKPRQPLEAICPENLHQVPADDCKCGVWAVCHPMLLNEIRWTITPPDGVDPTPGIVVVGQIAMWGNVVQHERGWRASHAYPTHLYAFTDDLMVAEGLRERYGVPVAFGPEAEQLRRFLPTPTPTAPPLARGGPRPTQPTRPLLSAELLALVEHLPKVLKPIAVDAVATRKNFLDRSSYGMKHEGTWQDEVVRAKKKLTERTKRRTWALARGGYLVRFYGAEWKNNLRDEVWEAAKDLVLQSAGQRAQNGDAAARRRLLWLLIARRWHETQGIYAELLHAEAGAKRRHAKNTGEKLCATTRALWKRKVELRREDLAERLQALAETPTPSYRDWCAMVPR